MLVWLRVHKVHKVCKESINPTLDKDMYDEGGIPCPTPIHGCPRHVGGRGGGLPTTLFPPVAKALHALRVATSITRAYPGVSIMIQHSSEVA